MSCDSQEYTNLIVPHASFALAIYPCGIIAVYCRVLWRYRAEILLEKKKDDQHGTATPITFLHAAFTPSCFFWEPIDAVRKKKDLARQTLLKYSLI